VKRMSVDGGIPAETLFVETGPRDTEELIRDRQRKADREHVRSEAAETGLVVP
jgi:hypothetical protein